MDTTIQRLSGEIHALAGKPFNISSPQQLGKVLFEDLLLPAPQRYGKGKTLLIGTFPGAGYYLHHSPEAKAFFADLLAWAGIEQQVRTNSGSVQARLHSGAGGNYLWVVNPSRTDANVKVSLGGSAVQFNKAEDVWGEARIAITGPDIILTVSPRDAAVLALR